MMNIVGKLADRALGLVAPKANAAASWETCANFCPAQGCSYWTCCPGTGISLWEQRSCRVANGCQLERRNKC